MDLKDNPVKVGKDMDIDPNNPKKEGTNLIKDILLV